MKYRVSHTTAYRYQDEVSSSYGQIHLLPRHAPGQHSEKSLVDIEPGPADYRQRDDFFGNRVAYFEILSPHHLLSVSTTSWVEVEANARRDLLAAASSLPDGSPWEGARVVSAVFSGAVSAVVPGGPVGEASGAVSGTPSGADGEGVAFLLDSPLVTAGPELAAYAGPSFQAGRPVVEALGDLAERIHDDFRYRPGATGVATTASEVLTKGEGVCQDFAHLAIGCLRSLGLPARYVSGYLETDPPAGRPRLTGADVSHAWASLLVPGVGWLDVDPTNRQFVNERYVVAAWGRDYTDVPPLKGVIFTEGTKHDLEVLVDVVRLDDTVI